MFHNEDFMFCNPFEFRDRFQATQDFTQYNDHKGARYWETNLIQEVNGFGLDGVSDERQRGKTHALHSGGYFVRLPHCRISPGKPKHLVIAMARER
jgi:hypothetical protein